MENDCNQCWTLWIDRENRIISFQKAEGFTELVFDSHEDMLRYAVDRGAEGFAIQ